MGQHIAKHLRGTRYQDWLGKGLLAEFLALIIHDYWNMGIPGSCHSHHLLQCQMRGSCAQQICAPHNVRDPLIGIIHNHGQVICPMTIGPA
jgi:hypothetical protein